MSIVDRNGKSYTVGSSRSSGGNTYGVYDKDERIGVATLDRNNEYVKDVRIHKDYQRKGIASQLYNHIERHIGKPLKPSPLRSDAGKAFWKGRKSESKEQSMIHPDRPFVYLRNTRSLSKHKVNQDFGQKIESAGRYMLESHKEKPDLQDGWESGSHVFHKPLYIHSDGWKAALSKQHGGKTGKKLSQAIRDAGHDGIVTHDKYGTGEIVDISHLKPRKHKVEALLAAYAEVAAATDMKFEKLGTERGQDMLGGKYVLDSYDITFGAEKVQMYVKRYPKDFSAKVNIFGHSANKFGPSNVKAMIAFIKKKYKNVYRIFGDRISGARAASGKAYKTASLQIRHETAMNAERINTHLAKVKQALETASSLSRVHQHMASRNVGMITAWRGDKTPEENHKRNHALAQDLKKAGHGFIKAKGRYVENIGTKDEKPVDESSYMVIGKKGEDGGALKHTLKRLGKKYDQDSVLHKRHDEPDAKLVGLKEGTFPGKDVEHSTGDFHPNRAGEFHTILRGRKKRKFAFNNDNENPHKLAAAVETTKKHDISPHSKNLYYLQPDGSFKKGGDGRTEGLTKEELPKGAELSAVTWKLPPEPGTAPIPKDHVRLYHQTGEKNLGSIKHNGIQLSRAKGYEGPKAIYADEKGFYGKPGDRPTVEFHVHKDRWHKPFVQGDVEPKNILAVHRDWHGTARYIENDSKLKGEVLAGKHDHLMREQQYGKAISFVKKKYGKQEHATDGLNLMNNLATTIAANLRRERIEARIKETAAAIAPRTLYLSRDMLNGDEFAAWAKEQGFGAIDTSQLHVTIAYSKAPVNWMKLGNSYSSGMSYSGGTPKWPDGSIVIAPGGPRIISQFDGGAVVLAFACDDLNYRNARVTDIGGSWDFPDYNPHITIAYNPTVDLTKVQPYTGQIVLGPEKFAELNENWENEQ